MSVGHPNISVVSGTLSVGNPSSSVVSGKFSVGHPSFSVVSGILSVVCIPTRTDIHTRGNSVAHVWLMSRFALLLNRDDLNQNKITYFRLLFICVRLYYQQIVDNTL